ncbi:MAG: gamma-glutamylcyclotransferase family protein [Pyrinomonadaceae bacterium]
MSQYLFSYGTLQSSEVQLALFGRELNGAADELPGYRKLEVEIDDERFVSKLQSTAVVSENAGDVVEGTAFEISSKELLTLDKYEPRSYLRRQVVLRSGKNAWLYTSGEVSK